MPIAVAKAMSSGYSASRMPSSRHVIGHAPLKPQVDVNAAEQNFIP
jgi:hypothetical protein